METDKVISGQGAVARRRLNDFLEKLRLDRVDKDSVKGVVSINTPDDRWQGVPPVAPPAP